MRGGRGGGGERAVDLGGGKVALRRWCSGRLCVHRWSQLFPWPLLWTFIVPSVLFDHVRWNISKLDMSRGLFKAFYTEAVKSIYLLLWDRRTHMPFPLLLLKPLDITCQSNLRTWKMEKARQAGTSGRGSSTAMSFLGFLLARLGAGIARQ